MYVCIYIYMRNFYHHFEIRENNHEHSTATSVHSNKLSAKNLDAVVPDHLLATNVDTVAYQTGEYKNSGLLVIFDRLNSLQHNN